MAARTVDLRQEHSPAHSRTASPPLTVVRPPFSVLMHNCYVTSRARHPSLSAASGCSSTETGSMRLVAAQRAEQYRMHSPVDVDIEVRKPCYSPVDEQH